MNSCLVFGSGSAGQRHARNARSLDMDVALVTRRNIRDFKTFENCAKALKGFSPTIIVIASKTSQHVRDLCEIVDLNLPTLIEKPLDTKRTTGLTDLVSHIRSNDSKHLFRVGYLMRYHPLVERLQSEICKVGTVHYVSCHFSQFLPWWRPESNYKQSYSADPAGGGGVLFDSSHEVDLLQYLFGHVEAVCADTHNFGVLGIEAHELCSASFRFKSGARADLRLDYLSRIPSRVMRIEGQFGSISIDFLANEFQINEGGKLDLKVDRLDIDRNAIFKKEFAELLEDPENSKLPDIESSLDTLRIFEQMMKSSRTNRWERM